MALTDDLLKVVRGAPEQGELHVRALNADQSVHRHIKRCPSKRLIVYCDELWRRNAGRPAVARGSEGKEGKT